MPARVEILLRAWLVEQEQQRSRRAATNENRACWQIEPAVRLPRVAARRKASQAEGRQDTIRRWVRPCHKNLAPLRGCLRSRSAASRKKLPRPMPFEYYSPYERPRKSGIEAEMSAKSALYWIGTRRPQAPESARLTKFSRRE